MKLVPTALAAALLGTALYAFGPMPLRADTGAATASPSPGPTAAATVDTKNFAYKPPVVTIHPGDSVLFKNSDSTAHTVTAADKSFDSGNMDQGATWTHVFAKVGTYAYVCAYHSYMQGTVIVK